MFKISDLQAIVSGNPINELEQYLLDNHMAITRKPYTGRQYSRNDVVCIVFSYICKTDSILLQYIKDQTFHLPTGVHVRERLYVMLNGSGDRSCQYGKTKIFNPSKPDGYKFCANHGKCQCQQESFRGNVYGKSDEQKAEIVSKRKATTLERHGVEFALQNSEIMERTKATNFDRYGTSSPLGNDAVRDKIKETNRNRYGFDYPLKSVEIQKKKTETMLDRYGVENPAHVEQFQKKKASTNLERYGSASPFGDKLVQEKSVRTNLDKFGNTNAMQNDVVKDKLAKKNIDKFGARSPFGNTDIQEKIKATNLERYGVENVFHDPAIFQKRKDTMIIRYGHESAFGNAIVRQKSMETKINRTAADYYYIHDQSDQTIDLIYEDRDPNWFENVKNAWIENRFNNPRHPFSIQRAYRNKVNYWTEKNIREYSYLLNADILSREYWQNHVDHIFSIRDGYLFNVPAEIIGHWTNLRLIPRIQNQRKSGKSERTLEEVIALFKANVTKNR
jgi:hypothetical protein